MTVAFVLSSPSKAGDNPEEASKRRLEERFGTGGMAGIGSAPLEEEDMGPTTADKLKVTHLTTLYITPLCLTPHASNSHTSYPG